jgi:hypothetical protein
VPYEEEVKKNIARLGIVLSDSELKHYLKEIQRSHTDFPYTDELAVCVGLLTEWEKATRRTVVYVLRPTVETTFPTVVAFGVMSSDWAGMADSCIGVLHERGWNIYFAKSFVLKHRRKELGVVVIAVQIKSSDELERLIKEQAKLVQNLEKASIGSRAKMFLMARETKKLETYSRVIELIERTRPKSEHEALIGKDGEAVKFFASRSEAYIDERRVVDLADQIIYNEQSLRRVRETGGKPQIRVKSIQTAGGKLTGITVVAFDRDISLNDCLSAIGRAVPGFVRKYNKEFTTGDGITPHRIEIADENGNAYSAEANKRIRRALVKMADTKRLERDRWIDSIGGSEQYARAIIPFLVREHATSSIPQVYIAVGRTSEYFVDFKIIIVVSSDRAVNESIAVQCAEEIESVSGLSILAAKPPKKFGSEEVDIIDVRSELDEFRNQEHIYGVIRKIIMSIVGDFRDFDEGMRRMDVQKLEEVTRTLEDVEPGLVRDLYYRLEDFHRASASIEELVDHIRLGVQALRKQASGEGNVVVEGKEVCITDVSGERCVLSTVIVAAYPSSARTFREFMDLLKNYEVTFSKMDRDGTALLMVRVTQQGKTLSEQTLETLLSEMRGVSHED